MIPELAQDLVTRVASIPALAASTGLALGGRGADPTLTQLPPPAAWVIYRGDTPDEPPYGNAHGGPALVPGVQIMLQAFAVIVYLPYTDQADLIDVQFPLLESVIQAIRGQDSPSGHRWRYVGQKLSLVYNDRIAYEQRYTADAVL